MNDEKSNESIDKKLIDALIMAQSQMTFASKTGTNPHFKSGYAPLEEVIDAVKSPLNDNGIFYLQKVHLAEGGVCVETEFHGWGSVLKAGKVFVPADKQTPHGYGSSLSYAKRYSLITATGLPSEDDDGNEAEKAVAKKPIPKKASPKKVTATEQEPKEEPKEEPKDEPTKEQKAEAFVEGFSKLLVTMGTEPEVDGLIKQNITKITAVEKYPDLNEKLSQAIDAKIKSLEETDKEVSDD